MGMPGLGALGVTFGLSVAMDSPSARPPGSFNWASTLWHELSHVYVLTATAHHVPRWFTEGVSVFEETASTKEWAEPVSKDASAAMKKDQLLPIQKLDRGFIRPDSPAQVGVSYFQAGQICEFIVETWGWEKILAMTRSFSKVTTTEAVVLSNLGLEPAEFDKRFKAWLAARKLEVAGPGTEHQRDPAHVKKAALEAQQRGDAAGAERMLTSLLAIYPVKDEELHRRLAAARAEVGNWPGAAEEWRTVIVMKTADPASAQYQLAVALRKMNRTDEARDAVLAALEAAPAYRPAQKLLLELNRKEQQ